MTYLGCILSLVHSWSRLTKATSSALEDTYGTLNLKLASNRGELVEIGQGSRLEDRPMIDVVFNCPVDIVVSLDDELMSADEDDVMRESLCDQSDLLRPEALRAATRPGNDDLVRC